MLTGAILMVQVVAIAGALGLGRLAGRYGAKRVVLGALVAWIGVLLAAFFLQAGAVVQFYALAAVIGLVQGGTQALSRSLFSQLIPRRQGGRVLRLLRDQRPRHQLARPARVRPDLPADRLLPARHRQPGDLLRRRRFVALAALPMRRAVVEAGNTPPERL